MFALSPVTAGYLGRKRQARLALAGDFSFCICTVGVGGGHSVLSKGPSLPGSPRDPRCPHCRSGASREGAPPFPAPPRATAPSRGWRAWTPCKRPSGIEPTAQHAGACPLESADCHHEPLMVSKAPQIWKTQCSRALNFKPHGNSFYRPVYALMPRCDSVISLCQSS